MEYTDFKHKALTEQIIKIFYNVYNELGFGFLEKVYQNAMYFELLENGFDVKAQKQIKVYFKGRQVGEYFADLVVNDLVILELKATETLLEEHEIQLINYLKATDIEVGLLLNFGSKPEFKRKAFSNDRKKSLKKSF
jgi:GxxExxY protein